MNCSYKNRTIVYAILLFCFFGVLYILNTCTGRKQTYEILVVHSYDEDCAWKDELNRGVKEAFKAHHMNVRIRTFYMNCEALLSKMEVDTLNLLLNQYKTKAPDLIITCDDAASFSLIETQHPYTYSVPIVFCGVDYVNQEILPGHNNITGFTTVPDFVQCYQLAKQLFGKISTIHLLIEDSYLGRIYKDEVYKQLASVPEITKAEEILHNDSIFIDLSHNHHTFEGEPVTLSIKRVDMMRGVQLKWNLYYRPNTVSLIPKWNPLYSQFPKMGTVPYLAVNNEGFGDGRIGGYMTPSYLQTYQASERGIKILKGASPSDFPLITKSKKIPVFDWNELKYWKIDLKRLPPHSVIPNMPFTERYKNSLIAAGIVGSLLIVLCIFWLIRLSRKEKRYKTAIQNNLVKEQQELSITMESINEGVLSIDKHCCIFAMNQAAIKWLQLNKPVETYIGKSIWDLFSIITRENSRYLQKLLEKLPSLPEGLSFSEDAFLLMPNHKTFPISGGINNIYQGDTIIGHVITFRDITHEYTQKEILALSMLGGDIFAWHYNGTNQMIMFDETLFNTFHIPDDGTHSLSRSQFIEMIHPEDFYRWRRTFLLIEQGKITKATIQLRINMNGEGFQWWEYRMSSMFQSSLAANYKLFGICLNIQHFKKTQEELTRFRDEAIESDRMKGVFMANMSHEIRTPLNAIVGFSTLLTENSSFNSEERKIFIETINENCRLLLNLINEILDISRIESGIQFRKEKCNLNELVEEVARIHRPNADKGVAIITRVPDEPVWIDTDSLRLSQLLGNLVSNAIKFTRQGHILIAYTFIPQKYAVSFLVEDTGIGISQEEQKRIFERFYKSDDFVQGGGLGLSICKEIAKRMNGTIRVESEINKGTRFIIDIPL